METIMENTRNWRTYSKCFMTSGETIEFWHNYKTIRGIRNRFEKYAKAAGTKIDKIQYCIKGEALK